MSNQFPLGNRNSHSTIQRHEREFTMRTQPVKFLIPMLVLSALPANASVFDTSLRWPAGDNGRTEIPVCIHEASSVEPTSESVFHVRNALQGTWEMHSNVRFTDWRKCTDPGVVREEAINLYIHPDAPNNSYIGTGSKGKGTVTPSKGTSFKPWGNDWNECSDWDFWPFVADYSCIEQYAIHEFGHAIGFKHEWRHPNTPATCMNSRPSQENTLSACDSRYQFSGSFDNQSIMLYDNSGCADPSTVGVRFANTGLSPIDIAGVANAYPSLSYHEFVLNVSTALGASGPNFEFALAPNRDLFVIIKSGTGSGKTEVHVLSAASNYTNFVLQISTALHQTGDNFTFLLAENRDLFAIAKSGTGSATTEVHVLSAASNYATFSLQTATALQETDDSFDFALAANRDVVAIKKHSTGTSTTEVHVLSAANNYAQFDLQTDTALHETNVSWSFLMAKNRDLFAVARDGTASGVTEVHVLR